MTEKKKLPQQREIHGTLNVSHASNARSVRQRPLATILSGGKRSPADSSQQSVRSAYHVQRVQRNPGSHNDHSDLSKRRGVYGAALAPRTLPRVVTVPQSTDSVEAWGTFEQRRRKLRRVRSEAMHAEQPVLVARTFRQTGVRATSGRIPAIRRPLPYRSSHVPVRSGRILQRGRSILKILVLACIMTIVLALSDFFFFSSTFQVQTVNVTGTSDGTLLADIQHMKIRGQNIFLFNSDSIRAQLSGSPLVSNVIVKKQWPDQLDVAITERIPVLLWQTSQGTYSVDQSGMVIAAVNQSDQTTKTGLGTVVERANGDSGTTSNGATNAQKTEPQIRPGTYLNHADIVFADSILQQLPVVTGINAFTLYYDGTMYASTTNANGGGDSNGSYAIESPQGWKVLIGGAQDPNSLKNRLQELREILKLAQTQHEQIATIDLRYGLRPVFTVKQ
ncbi:FtsQ-type POTRA domain-containing protein [Ktedonobacteria bacterium brp13]|nr:FtsQ-type POTRA domain-containing protein [Ktedonobacteria bacterium brp13]